jgi:hypothetical protein
VAHAGARRAARSVGVGEDGLRRRNVEYLRRRRRFSRDTCLSGEARSGLEPKGCWAGRLGWAFDCLMEHIGTDREFETLFESSTVAERKGLPKSKLNRHTKREKKLFSYHDYGYS